jgi:multidrug transporter EmrE-like cation transporter
MKSFIFSWGIIFLSALCDSYAAYVVKFKFNELGKFSFNSFASFSEYFLKFFGSPLLISGIVAFAFAPALWFIALNRIDLSVGYPVLVVFHLIFVMLTGQFLLGESINIYKIIGTILILLSLFFFYKSSRI